MGVARLGHERCMTPKPYTSRKVITAYLVSAGLFTLAASLIWAVNTLFLMDAGLTIYQVMVVNAVYTASMIFFEVPTGVIADTLGRKTSFLISIAVLIAATMFYVASPYYGWGIAGFAIGSALIGLGFCFQTGATDAWLVDALSACGYEGTTDVVFARGGMVFGAAMLVGTLAGGFLGQIDLSIPYLVRAAILVVAFVVSAVMMREVGFERRAFKPSEFARETRTIFDAGVRYGWNSRSVRPLLWASLLGGMFFMYGFYAWQRYLLDLLGTEAIWLVGIVQALSAGAGIAGNFLVKPVMGSGESRREPARVLAFTSIILAALMAAIGAVGLLMREPGWAPFAVAATLWVLFGVLFGVRGPIYQSYSNSLIPSAQRATVLSVDALFGDLGGTVGQPALGRFADQAGFPASFVLGGLLVLGTWPLFLISGKWAKREPLADPAAGAVK